MRRVIYLFNWKKIVKIISKILKINLFIYY